MTSVVAALIAFVAGVAVAALLYYKRSAESRWDLALLRLTWFGLLVYALLAPEKLVQSEREIRPVLTVLLDSSRSLGVDADSLSQTAFQRFEGLGYEPIFREFDEDRIPSNVRWAYVGDGHIENISEEHSPEYYLITKSKPLQPLSLLQGIAVPQRILRGSKFHVNVLAANQANVRVVFNGKSYEGTSLDLIAPKASGIYSLLSVGRSSGRTDSLKTSVVVQESLATVVVASNMPHPHEAMVRRWCKKRGIEVQSLTWKDLDKVDSFKGPLITIGGGDGAIAMVRKKISVPMLHLDAGAAPAFREQERLETLLGENNIPVFAKVKQPQVVVAQSLDARGIHWYKSGLASERAFETFQALLEELMQRYEPAQLRIVHSQQVAAGQRVMVSGAVVNSRQEVLPADFKIQIKRQNEWVEQLTLREDGASVKGSFRPIQPGVYEVVSESIWSGGTLESRTTLQVAEIDVELIRERNENLLAQWKENGAQDALQATQKVAVQKVSYEKKNPQHLHWWYWGLALLAAAIEWSLRRRSGLV
jgi:hypothetical protein